MMHLLSLLKKRKNGFALIEVLIALTVLSVILLSIYSGISTSINIVTGAKDLTTAMTIVRSKLTEFRMNRFREPDMSHEEVEGYESFLYSRTTTNYESELLGPLSAKRTEVTVFWKQNGKEKEYSGAIVYVSN